MREGRLTVIAGPMFAGKTTALLDRVDEAVKNGFDVGVYKPTLDTRHAQAEVVSHDGRRHPAQWIAPSLIAPLALPKGADVVAIDEAQFLSEEAIEIVTDLVGQGYSVILAGLDLTWKGKPFGHLPSFMAFADEVVKLRARCACGKSACRSYRLVRSEETVLVGGAGTYEPRCLPCFQSGG